MVFVARDVAHPFDDAPDGEPDPLHAAVLVDRADVHALLRPICAAFGLADPPVYRAKRAEPGCLFGQAGSAVVLAEDLLDDPADALAPDELVAVLAHQCGHLLRRGRWTERSELTADRAAALYLGDADPITRAIFRVAGRADPAEMLTVRVREVQAWTVTAGFARLRARLVHGSM